LEFPRGEREGRSALESDLEGEGNWIVAFTGEANLKSDSPLT